MKTEATMNTSDDLIASYSSRGPDECRSDREARRSGSGQSGGLAARSRLNAGERLSGEHCPRLGLYDGQSFRHASVFPIERHQYGDSGGLRRRRADAAKRPQLTPDTVKARLMKTASKKFPVMSTATDPTTGQTYTDFYDLFTVGAGYVDIASALTNYEQMHGSAASPQITLQLLCLERPI